MRPCFRWSTVRATARTIYPPAAQAIFAAVGLAAPTVTAMKAAMVAFEALAMACAGLVLVRLGLPPARIVVWAWNPLAVWSFAGNGHIDAAAAGLLGLALLLAGRGRGALSGLVFALAAPDEIPAPGGGAGAVARRSLALRRRRGGDDRWRSMPAMPAPAVHVLGFLPGYAGRGRPGRRQRHLAAGRALAICFPLSVVGWHRLRGGGRGVGLGGAGTVESPWSGGPATPLRDLAAGRSADGRRHHRHQSPLSLVFCLAGVARHGRALARAGVACDRARVLLEFYPFGGRFLWPALVVYLPALVLALADFRRPPGSPFPPQERSA